MRKIFKKNINPIDGPILDKVKVHFSKETNFSQSPFSLKIIQKLQEITFPTQVTFGFYITAFIISNNS